MSNANKHNLLIIGIILFLAGGILNGFLVSNHIGGLIRELARLAIIAGFVITIIGLIRKFTKRKINTEGKK